MRKVAALICVALAVTLLAPAGAGAFQDVTTTPTAQRDLAIAAAYWHVTPAELAAREHCASYRVEVGPIDEDTLGEAAQPGCWMRLSPEEWERAEGSEPQEQREACLAIVHEYGHSTGHGHSPDPASVMAPEELWLGAVPGCTAAYPLASEPPRPAWHRLRLAGSVRPVILTLRPGQPVTLSLGMIPATASISSRIYLHPHPKPFNN